MKTSELTGAKLDYWVAKAEGIDGYITIDRFFRNHPTHAIPFSPSTDWSQGGQIIEREGMNQYRQPDGTWYVFIKNPDVYANATGDTALMAAMRCFVASKFGSELPDDER